MSWNGSDQVGAASSPRQEKDDKLHSSTSTFNFKALVAGMIIALVGGLIVWLSFGRAQTPAAPKERQPAHIAKAKPAVAPVVTNAVPKVRDPHEGHVLSPAGVWQPTNRPWRANAKKVHNVHTNWSHSVAKKVPYRNAVEQMLLTTFSCPLGECPPPYVRISQADMESLVAILIDKPEIAEDDTESQIKDKQLIAAAKKEMQEYIRKGGKPDLFFKAYHNQLQKAYEKRLAAIQEVNRIVTEEGDAGLARDFQAEMNRRFKKEGIRPIHMDIK